MKYKLLLVGKNKGLINDFFMQMDTFFDCLTSSMRFSDLLGHLKYFNPHAVVFCMNAENKTLPMVAADEWLHPVEDEINRRYNMYTGE